jgi:hypothetical protein
MSEDERRIRVDNLTPADVALLKQIADEAAAKAVHQFAIRMGIDPDDPRSSQADQQFLRATRERCEQAGFKAVLTLIGILVAGGAGMLWLGFKAMVKQ